MFEVQCDIVTHELYMFEVQRDIVTQLFCLQSEVLGQSESTVSDCTQARIVHYLGAAPGSCNLKAILLRLCHELQCTFQPGASIPSEMR